MKILVINHNLRERGTWHRAWHLARELGRRNHQVTLWTVAPDHYYRCERTEHGPEEGRVVEIQTPSWSPLADPDDGWGPLSIGWRLMHALYEKHDFCYAFAHPPNVWLPAWVARRVRRRPLLYDWCDWYEGGIFPKRAEARQAGLTRGGESWLQRRVEKWEISLERRMLHLADRVTVISEHLGRLAIQAGRRREDVLVLPNGANLSWIAPLDSGACRSALRLPDPSGPILGYVANYHPDQELLLKALARAILKIPNLRLLVAGAPFSEALVEKLDLEDSIVHLGRVPAERIGLILGAADALALPLEDNPSNRARVPYKFTDYLAAARPVVTNPVGDLARWFAPDASVAIGLAASPTPEAYGAAIARLMRPGVDRISMGRAARAMAERYFAWPRLVDRLETFIGDWLGSEEE